MSRFLPPLLLICCFLALAWLLPDVGSNATSGGGTGELRVPQDYDYYLSEVSSTRFDASGQAAWQLGSTRVTHYPEGDIATLENPSLSYLRGSDQPWQVNARHGTLQPDLQRREDRLDLDGDVLLRQIAVPDDMVEARTETLTVFPATEEASTEAAIVMHMRDGRVEGVGMRAWMARQRIDLLSQVRGHHAPATQNR